MSQGSNDSLDKGQQEAMLAHMIRCPRFYPLVHSGRINQEDFDWIYLRAAFQCLVGVMMIQGPDHPVGTMALMDQFKLVRRASNLNPVEEQQVLQFVVYTFSLQTSEAYYWAQLENYLGTMRTLREVRKLKSSEWRLAADKIGAVASQSKINAGAICRPLMNYDITVAPETVPTGIRSIDRRLAGGGLGLKEYGILCAYTGVGKTTLALNFAWGAARSRKKACFATLELDESKIRERLYSLIGRYDYNAIRYGRGAEQSREECWDEAVARVQAYGSEFASYLSVWDFSTEVCSISTLEDNLRREIAEDPHNPPKMLVVDWLLCLDEDMTKFDPKAMRDKEMRHKLQRYSDELSKRIARKYQVAVWATHQADAKAENVEVVTTKHSAEGKSAAWKCSVYLGVGTTLEQREKGIFTVTASKTRDGQTFTTKIHGALDQQRFESNDEEGSADPSMMIEGISLQDRIRHRDAAAAAAAEPEQPAEAGLTPPPPPL